MHIVVQYYEDTPVYIELLEFNSYNQGFKINYTVDDICKLYNSCVSSRYMYTYTIYV